MRHVLICAIFLASVMAGTTHGVVVVGGESMSPALGLGDVCVYRRNADPEVGDVVFYRRSDGAGVVHRVIEVGPRGELRTKGDASDVVDREPILESQVAGPVVWRLPGPGGLGN